MRRYVLDTNVVLYGLRDHQLYQRAATEHRLGSDDALVMISVVTVGELLSLAEQNGWGAKKKEQLESALRQLIIVDVSHADDAMMQAYSRIDAYSQGRLTGHTLSMSSRNMGKNDLWIAATASVTNATLLTTDADFDHLNTTMVNVVRLKP